MRGVCCKGASTASAGKSAAGASGRLLSERRWQPLAPSRNSPSGRFQRTGGQSHALGGRGKSGKLSRRLKTSRLVLGQRSTESRELTVGFQSTEAGLRLQHAGRLPSQSHRRIAPALHVPCHATDRTLHVLDRVCAGQQIGVARAGDRTGPRHRRPSSRAALRCRRRSDRSVRSRRPQLATLLPCGA